MKTEYKRLFDDVVPDRSLTDKITHKALKKHHNRKRIKTFSKSVFITMIILSVTLVSYAGISAPDFLVSSLGGNFQKVNELFSAADIMFEGTDDTFSFVYKGMLANAFDSYIVYEIHSSDDYVFIDDKSIEYYDNMNIEIKPFWFGSGGCSGSLKYKDKHTLEGYIIWDGDFPLLGMKAALNATKIGIIKKTYDEACQVIDVEREVIANDDWNISVKFYCTNPHCEYNTDVMLYYNNCNIEFAKIKLSPINISIKAEYSGKQRFLLSENELEIKPLLLYVEYRDGSVHNCGHLSYSGTYHESSGKGKITFSALPTEILEYSEIVQLIIIDYKNSELARIAT